MFSSECSIEQTIDSNQMEEGWKTGKDDGGGPLGEVQKQNFSSKLTLRKKGVGVGRLLTLSTGCRTVQKGQFCVEGLPEITLLS